MQKFKSDIVYKNRIYRWDIYYCSLDQDIANKDSCLIGKPNRPCLIVSNDHYNKVSPKVLVMPFCSCNEDGITPEEYVENEKEKGGIVIPMTLNRDRPSFLIVNQPRLIYQSMLQDYVGTLDINLNPTLADRIDEEIFKFIIDEDVFCRSNYFKYLIQKHICLPEIDKKVQEIQDTEPEDFKVAAVDDTHIETEEIIEEISKSQETIDSKKDVSSNSGYGTFGDLLYELIKITDPNYTVNSLAKENNISYLQACTDIAENEMKYNYKF